MTETVSFVAGHAAVLAALALTAVELGRCGFPVSTGCSRLEGWALGATLGLALLGQAALLLGLAGALRREKVGLLAILAIVASRFRSWPLRVVVPARTWLLGAVALVSAGTPLFLATLYPPHAFDETLYHLPTARAFAASGALPFLADLRVPVFQQLGDLLMAVVLLWSDDVATHLVAFLATLLTAALVVAWGRRIGRPLAGLAAGALYLGNPVVAYLSGTGYVDTELALFATGAMFSADTWRLTRKPAWLAAAAFLAGSAASTKLFGLHVVAGLVVWVWLHAPRERRLRDLALALGLATAAAAPTYGRLVYWTGNPAFPFLAELFGPSPWTPAGTLAASPVDRVWAVLTLPWDLVLRRAAVGEMPPYSPVYLLGLPVLALGVWTSAWVRGAVLACAAYVLAVPANARYVLAVAPLASLALAMACAEVVARLAPPAHRGRGLAWALCAALAVPGWLYALHELRREGPLPVTPQARDTYLAARLPVYPAIRYLNEARGERYVAYQLGAEQMVYFARGRLIGDHAGLARYDALLGDAPDAGVLLRRLGRWGVDHLVVTRAARPRLPGDPATWPGVRRVYADGHADVFELGDASARGPAAAVSPSAPARAAPARAASAR